MPTVFPRNARQTGLPGQQQRSVLPLELHDSKLLPLGSNVTGMWGFVVGQEDQTM